MTAHHLSDGWTLSATGGVPEADPAVSPELSPELSPALVTALRDGVPARVPGTSHTALLDAGLIPDPYLDRNEEVLAWMRHVDWRYEHVLDEPAAAPDERVDLAFDGLDTVATISVVGRADQATVVGRTANQHRSYRFDVRELVGGPATLRVDLASALHHAEAEARRLGPRPLAYPQPFNMIRKMACSFGWDWGPDLQTAGPWRPVRVERWRVARLAQVRPVVTVRADGTGVAELHVTVERSGLPGGDAPLALRAEVAGVVATAGVDPGDTHGVLRVEVPDAPLWWPVGHGEQPLVDAVVGLAGPDGTVLGTWRRRLGFRTVTVDRSRDEHGTRFTFVVNGREIFVRGANWIPDDHLLTRITRDRLARRIDQALGAHLNLLRVWGGGIYESEDFYELCDERGVLVWQDFLLACAAYPEESPLLEELTAEAREHVVRLASHPSLVLWNGGNENVWGHEDWGWKAELDGRTWGLRYAAEIFPAIVAELDPTRPYSDNSPYSPGFAPEEVHPDDPDHGTHHQWEVWNRVDYTHYRDDVPRFCSEFGFQGPPTWATLTRAVHPADGGPLTPEDPTFLLHQKAEDGNGKLARGLAPHLGVPADFVDWHWATQLNQARAVAYAVEHHRSWWPRTAGSIVWQLNDCWPVTSWAAVDGDERVKPLWWALRHAHAPRLLTVQPRDDGWALVAVNDTGEAWTGTATLERQQLDGTVLAAGTLEVTAAPRTAAVLVLPQDLAVPGDARTEALVVRLGDERVVHVWADDVDLALEAGALTATAQPEPGGWAVTVTARSLVRDATLLVDRLDPDATVDAALVDLPAGATATFHVRTTATLDAADLVAPPVLRSANDVVVPAAARV
ncbi:glycosyl hydrolase 2 galactose-binding domain-containing protein [Cellulomonas gilvus]|uniref:beta-mannosidase n=1 Tax=Cellulomonas gilvus (strain ATCC 13127 / NRRL B-14078) TaxID=593907 RepID=F8A1Y5_CELGA|nr:glycoside hydrolase family 2 protein [Cellulomonas gilvus]AEI12929.1 beta-mannosidase [Cellulomonas gilvus ATCC 13127]